MALQYLAEVWNVPETVTAIAALIACIWISCFAIQLIPYLV